MAVIAGAGIWELVGLTVPKLVPPIQHLGTVLWQNTVSPSSLDPLWPTIGMTLLDVAIGFSAALVLGVALGTIMAVNKTVERICDMYLYWALAIPELALVPVYVVIFGFGLTSRIMLIMTFAVPVIAQRTVIGVAASGQYLPMAKSYECRGAKLLLKIVAPAALPSILAGARLGYARSMLAVIAAGFLFKLFGIGGSLFVLEEQQRTTEVFVYLGVLVIINISIIQLLRSMERRLTHWTISVNVH